jgi:hypothetical protein
MQGATKEPGVRNQESGSDERWATGRLGDRGGLLRRSKIFIDTGPKLAPSSVGAAYRGLMDSDHPNEVQVSESLAALERGLGILTPPPPQLDVAPTELPLVV